MESLLANIGLGFSVALQPFNLFYSFLGVIIGTAVGVLPGLGPSAAIALLLPATFKLQPASAIILLAGIYYGAMYGGSTTSILVNIPGESASVVTCLDGYQMARKGRAGAALAISAIGSFMAGTFAIVGLMLLSPLLTRFALAFGPPEYFALMVSAISILTYLASGSQLKAMMMAFLGMFLGTIGTDIPTGFFRFCFGSMTLYDGIGIVPVAIGLFGIAEILENIEQELSERELLQGPISGLWLTKQDWIDSSFPMLRGSILGFFLGILPGGGATIASFTAYAVEKKLSKHPENFGKGTIEGVASPEAANNAAAGGAFIPLLSLGIPPNVVMALLLGALVIHGIQPGPLFVTENADLFWGVVVSMYIGNAMLLILNLPLIGIWVRLLRVSPKLLFPLIVLFCLIGTYTLNNNYVEIIIMILFGLLGYLMRKFGYEAAPLIFGFVLSPITEVKFRQSLLMSEGDFSIFFTRPISFTFMLIGIVLILLPLFARKRIAVESSGL
jgi:putative tricarboxylic transport membrane protein